MLFVSAPSSSHDVLTTMVGALGTGWISVISYYCGSSADQARQTELLAQAPAIIGK